MSLRKELIRLAHEKPELRDELLPLIKSSSTRDEKRKVLRTLQQAANALATAELQLDHISQHVSDKDYDQYFRGNGLLASSITMGVTTLSADLHRLMADIERSK